jgi:hypothetical protein
VIFLNSTLLHAITPPGVAGLVSVSVTDIGGTGKLDNAYTYTSGPVIYGSLNPASGLGSGGTTVNITGFNLGQVNQVLFGNNSANIVSVDTSAGTVVQVITPPSTTGGGPVDVTVNAPNGFFPAHRAFTYVTNLTITTTGMDTAYPTVPYSVTLQAANGTPPYSWSVSAGSLPPGLTLNSLTGLVSGNVAANYGQAPNYGEYPVQFKVKDSVGATATSPPFSNSKYLYIDVFGNFQPGPIPATFFGMTLFDPTGGYPTWPAAPFRIGALGKGLNTSWPWIEQVKGVYDWSVLDYYVQLAQENGLDIYYTMVNFPPWAESDTSSCIPFAETNPVIYACTDMVQNIADWDNFVTALVTRYKPGNTSCAAQTNCGSIFAYELYNEPDGQFNFTGTTDELVTLTTHEYSDITAADPNAKILSPSFEGQDNALPYFQAGGVKTLDAYDIHGYPWNPDAPETVLATKVKNAYATMTQLGFTNIPLWDSEGSWGGSNANTDPDFRASFVPRSLLLHWSAGIGRYYWYCYDCSTWGTLWTPEGGLSAAGTAYEQAYNWMLGATMPAPCSQNGGYVNTAVYTCPLTRPPSNYQALAVWDASQSCSNGVCTTSPYTIPSSSIYIQYRDILGNTTPIAPGQTLQIGLKPILLENMAAPPPSN